VDELLGLCDRILVMSKGQITNTIEREQMSKDLVLQYVTKGQ
jgi:ABC-type sugar transport system ATPase subunit